MPMAVMSGARRGVPVTFESRPIGHLDLRRRVRLGICLVPGNAMQAGLVPTLSVEENIVLPSAPRLQRFGVLPPRAVRSLAERMIAALDIRPRDPTTPIQRLSGGNRQKVVIAKWLAAGARVLLMDDPTKAVDVGAKLDIYRLMSEAAADGAAVLFVSSEIEELVGLCDRIVVVHQGRLVASHDTQPFSKEAVAGDVVGSRTSHAAHHAASI